MEFNRESYDKGKAWFYESEICLRRSLIIRSNPIDTHGAIEALQHCFELSCKSLYVMLDLPYPKEHDAAKKLDQVSEKMFQIISGADQENGPPIESWIKKNSEYLKKIHETSIYGDEEKDILASKLFSNEEFGDLMVNVTAIWSFIYHTLYNIGKQYNALTQEELKRYQEFSKLSILAYKNKTEYTKNFLKKIFSSNG